MKKMKKSDYVREISDVTNLKEDVVKSVIDAFSDIVIREAVLTGEFTLEKVFSIKTRTRKKRLQYNVNSGKYLEYPEIDYLTINLSKKIQGYHRWKRRNEYNEKHGLTQEDWADRDTPEIPTSKNKS